MLNLALFASNGQAKLAQLSWEIWTGQPGGGCPETQTPSLTIPCDVTLYDDSLTCDGIFQFTGQNFMPDQCLLFNGNEPQWMISCPHAPNNYLSGQLVESHPSFNPLQAMQLKCSDATSSSSAFGTNWDFYGGAWANAVHNHQAPGTPDNEDTPTNWDILRGVTGTPAPETPETDADLGDWGKSHPIPSSDSTGNSPYDLLRGPLKEARGASLGATAGSPATSPAPSPKGNDHLLEKILIPIAVFVVIAGCLGVYFCRTRDGKKEEEDAEPIQVVSIEEATAKADEDDEKVHTFIDHNDETPKKKGFMGLRRSLLFGKKKPAEGADVGYRTKSHTIPVNSPEDDAHAESEPLTVKLNDVVAEPSFAEDGPKAGEKSPAPALLDVDKPLVVTTCADATDSSAGYPKLDDGAAPPKNNLF